MHFSHSEGRRCGGRARRFGQAEEAAFASGFGQAAEAAFASGFGHGRFGGRGGEGSFGDGSFGGGRFGRHGGRRRRIDAETLRLAVLKLLAAEPRHGYDIIRAIGELTGGAYAPSPGVVYPLLSLLAEMGLIAQAEGDSSRRNFALTADGEACLVANAEAADAAVAGLKALGEAAGGADPAPVRRAMANLAAVLQARLREPGTDKARLLEVAALIDEAAHRIERL
jgi:DNA-binding PadR family transcriptional regulator